MKSAKYHNKKTCVNGITFDSAKEAKRYTELVLLQRAGKIRRLRLQLQFTLEEAYKDAETGESVKALRYVADFGYEELIDGEMYSHVDGTLEEASVWRPVVEDVKGHKTKEYELKKKLLRNRFGVRIRET